VAKSIKVGYTPWFERSPLTDGKGPLNYYGWNELVHFDLEKLDTWQNSKVGFMKCPAFVKYVDQIWVVRALIDVEIEWDKSNKVLLSNLPPMAHDAMVKVHWGDFDPENDKPIVALNTATLFYADEEVWVDFLPPWNHIDPKFRIMPGSFNICNWQRPVIPTFEMLDDKITFKRGQPLAYIKFRTRDPQDLIKLVKQPRTDQLDHIVNSSVSLKSYQSNISWKIVTGALPNKQRPKKLVKTEPWICRFFRKFVK